jgi:4-alpha-glucanotransferase
VVANPVDRIGVRLQRSSGVLLHPTSLPGGLLGEEAFRFVDWLVAAGQSWWSILPLTPPDEHRSPYAATSAFAGWDGLLAEPDAPVSASEVEEFVARHPYWIGDWAAFNDGRETIAGQVRFEREWLALRRYANERGVRILGDLPIYVAPGGADHRAYPQLFDDRFVAGAPPDDYSATGQLWGNPVYRWSAHRAEGYRWWTERMRRTFELVDVTRIDHFRGFVAFWATPAGRKTAKTGRWERGPGRELFDTLARHLGHLNLVAENLGVITPTVERLRHELGLPGMVVLLFAFAGGPSNPHRLENHEVNTIVYTGTHDMYTAVGWYEVATPEQRAELDAALGRARIAADDLHWAIVRLAMSSRASVSLVPAQDLLGLGGEARMNTPGRREGNWSWRLEPGQLTDELAARLRAATLEAQRAPAKSGSRRRR